MLQKSPTVPIATPARTTKYVAVICIQQQYTCMNSYLRNLNMLFLLWDISISMLALSPGPSQLREPGDKAIV